MGKLKRVSGEEIVKTLKRLGFEPVRQRGRSQRPAARFGG